MAQPNYGEVRIISNDGFGDDLASFNNLEDALERSNIRGGGIIELTTSLGRQNDQHESEVEKKPCPTNTNCTVFVTINRNNGKVVVSTKNGMPIPKDCIQCAGKRVLSATGFIISGPMVGVKVVEEA